jgi:hypothetical protein
MKPYRAALLLVCMFLSAVVLCLAAHPLEGTWKLNATQSRIAPNQPDAPKEETMMFRLIGDQFELTDRSTLKDGTSSSAKETFPVNGGVFKVLQTAPAAGESNIETMIEPGNRFLTSLKDGKQTAVRHLVISKDGKRMSITLKSADAKGTPFESVLIYDKQ